MSWLQALIDLDRRWVFLLIALAVLLPILLPTTFPEYPSPLVEDAFDKVEALEPGSRVFMAFDYDPGSAPELHPMAVAWTWHCAQRGHKIYMMNNWPFGIQMITDVIEQVIEKEFGEDSAYRRYVYGEDYVNLGFKPGGEAVIRLLATNLKQAYPTDHRGNSLNELPITRDVDSLQDMDLIISLGSGTPGTKEWIQYVGTPYGVDIIAGCTGVSAPLLYPYIPGQLQGLLGAIKGAAEYEAQLALAYPGEYGVDPNTGEEIKLHTTGRQRMGPQLFAHCVILLLIVIGNIILFLERRPREARR